MENIPVEKKSKKSPWTKVWISLGALLFVVVGVSIFEYFRIAPNNVYFSNVTSSSVTVSWNTKRATSASVLVTEGEKKIPVSVVLKGERYFDTRDVTNAELAAAEETAVNALDGDLTVTMDDFETDIVITDRGSYYTHHVTVTNLDPETEYSFMVGDKYLFRSVEGLTKTLEVPDSVKSPVPAYGVVKDAENQEELTVAELTAVTDGIMYFNYYETTTGARSNILSSVLNSSGNWYIDVSGVVDEEGVPFFEAYNSVENEFMIELTLDAGQLGIWKTKRVDGDKTPAPEIIINSPSIIDNEEIGGAIKEVSSIIANPLIQKVFAAQPASEAPPTCDSECLFRDYCGPCAKQCGGIWYECDSCSQKTLCDRGCNACENEETQESKITCGGYPIGTSSVYGSDCKVCTKALSSNGYYYGKWVTNNTDYDRSEGCSKSCTDRTCAQLSNGNYVYESCTDTDEYTCKPENFDNCGIEKVCYQRDYDDGGCTQESCDTLSNSSYPFSSCTDTSQYSCSSQEYISCDQPVTCFKKVSVTGGGDISVEYYFSKNGCTPVLGEIPYTQTYSTKEACLSANGLIDSGKVDLEANPSDRGVYYGASPENDFIIGSDGIVHIITDLGGLNEAHSQSLSANMAEDLYNLIKGKSFDEWNDYDRVSCNKGNSVSIYSEDLDNYVLFYCSNGYWMAWSEYVKSYPLAELPAGVVEPTKVGKECLYSNCICEGGAENKVIEGQICREVSDCNLGSLEKTCSRLSESICQIAVDQEYEIVTNALTYYSSSKNDLDKMVCVEDDNKCYTGKTGSGNLEGVRTFVKCLPKENGTSESLDNDSVLFADLVKEILGESNQILEYIIDPETGMISNILPGSYAIEYNGDTYAFEVYDYNLNSSGGEVLIYLDANENGKYDEETDTKISDIASEINIIALEQRYDYELTEGLNFVSFPFLIANSEFRTAAGLLQKLNEVYNDSIYSISTFDGGKWKMVGQNVEVYDNNDFQLLPGVGYMIKAKEDVDISIVGQPIQYESESDSAPISLFSGWNLIGLYGTNVKSYTAKTLIQDINADDFTADNVTQWETDKQMYEGFQLSDGQEYGFDFPLNKLESYFVRITQGSGNWQPELQ